MNGNGAVAPLVHELPGWVASIVQEWTHRGLSGQLTLNFHRGNIGTVEIKRRVVEDDVSA